MKEKRVINMISARKIKGIILKICTIKKYSLIIQMNQEVITV
jgi:hypothetical protein